MSPHAQNVAIAGACGIKPAWFLMKRGLYYRPNAKGYTSDPAEAGRFGEAEANLHINPHDEPVTKHPVPNPDYLNDLNAMREATTGLDILQSMDFAVHISRITGAPRVPDRTWLEIFQACHATAAQRAEAFLRTLSLWDDTQ